MPEFDEYGQIIPESKQVPDIPPMDPSKRPQPPQRTTSSATPPAPPPKKKGDWSGILIGIVVGVFICIGLFVGILMLPTADDSEKGVVTTPPTTVPIAGEADTINTTITVAYGSEKQAWLEDAKARFETQHPTITVDLVAAGSQEIVNNVIDGQLQATAVSPASTVQIRLLQNGWRARNNGADIVTEDSTQSLFITPLVLVAWEDRGSVLWPDGSSSAAIWANLHDVLNNDQGWAAFGQPAWGKATFAQTSPETSNSGIQTILLMAYDYHKKTSGLTVDDIRDPGFQAWFANIQRHSQIGKSTGFLMDDMIARGPDGYDAVAVYENLAIGKLNNALSRWNQPLRVYYPPSNILSDHPYAILNAPWVSDEQRRAAEQFGEFLRSTEMQQRALTYGFRPAHQNIAITETFNKYTAMGIQVEIPTVDVGIPPADVLIELINLWSATHPESAQP